MKRPKYKARIERREVQTDSQKYRGPIIKIVIATKDNLKEMINLEHTIFQY